MRLFEGFKPEEEKLTQYAGVYVLKWRPEFREPEMLFREVDVDVERELNDAAARLDFLTNWIENSYGGSNEDVELGRSYARSLRKVLEEIRGE